MARRVLRIGSSPLRRMRNPANDCACRIPEYRLINPRRRLKGGSGPGDTCQRGVNVMSCRNLWDGDTTPWPHNCAAVGGRL